MRRTILILFTIAGLTSETFAGDWGPRGSGREVSPYQATDAAGLGDAFGAATLPTHVRYRGATGLIGCIAKTALMTPTLNLSGMPIHSRSSASGISETLRNLGDSPD